MKIRSSSVALALHLINERGQMLRHIAHQVRHFSHTRPPIYEILPSKRSMNRVLFDLDSRHPFAKLYPVYESVYKSLDSEDEVALPRDITASDLMIMKRALETIRTQSHTTNKNLLALENSLVELSAEHGNNDAVALLAFEAIVSETAPGEDKQHAKKLVSALLELNHPLTLKLSGDLCLRQGLQSQAQKFYTQFLSLEHDTFLASEVYKQLGILAFQAPDLPRATQYFQRSIATGPLDKVAEAHYYLGQLSTHDAELSRHHFQMAASQGFKESFQQLGFLELNHFGQVRKALEWFRLGSELGDVSCVVGLFDCYVQLEQWKMAYASYNTIKDVESVWVHFEKSRAKSLELMHRNYAPLKETLNKIKDLDTIPVDSKNDRWML